jgi:hypothetical protein
MPRSGPDAVRSGPAVFPLVVVLIVALYGPKIGFLDTSLLAGPLGLLLLALLRAPLRFPSALTLPVLVLLGLAGYIVLVHSIVHSSDAYPILRVVRALLATILLGLVVTAYPIAPQRKIDGILAALSVNSAAMVVELLSPTAKRIVADVYQADPTLAGIGHPLRAFGLTAGFDAAGLFCLMGLVLASFALVQAHRPRDLALAGLFAATGLLASRLNMLLTLAGVLVAALTAAWRSSWKIKIACLAIALAGGLVATRYVGPLVAGSFHLGGRGGEGYDLLGPAVQTSYANTDLAAWWSEMWVAPPDRLALLFGQARDFGSSDIGFVKVLFMYGVVGGLCIAVLYLYYFAWSGRWLRRSWRGVAVADARAARILAPAVLVWVVLHVAFGAKNLYFLTRGFYELIVVGFAVASQAAATRWRGRGESPIV